MQRLLIAICLVVAGVGGASIGTAHGALAAPGGNSDTVTNCSGAYSTPGSLPYEVANASAGDTINFGQDCSGGSAIPLSSVITISENLTIDGTGHSIVIDGGYATQLFSVNAGVTLGLTGLTLSHGNANSIYYGGAIDNYGTVTITNSTLSGNSATYGGAIYNFGTVTITTSTLSGNSAPGSGGAIFNRGGGTVTITTSTLSGNSAPSSSGGAIGNFGTVSITTSTLSGNSAPYGGGAIANSGGTVSITTSTLSGNSATSDGGAIYTSYGNLSIGGSIVASSGGNCYNSRGTITDEGYNLEYTGGSSYSCLTPTATNHDITGTDPQLVALATNGGPTQTMALGSGSPAIDHIPAGTSFTVGSTTYTLCPSSGTTTDQRGDARPDNSETTCDIGAYEYQDPAQQAQTITFTPLSNKTYGDAPFTVSASASSGLTISFSSATTSVCTVSGSTVTIQSAGTCTIDADQAGDGNYTAASMVSQNFTINQATPTLTWATPSSITYGTTLDSTQLDATANVPGTFTYTPAAGTLLDAGTQSLTVSFTPTDTTDYTTASQTVTLTVNPATAASLQSLIASFCTDPSVTASLQQDVTAIVSAPNAHSKAGALQGYINLVNAQIGKSLTSAQANILITVAQSL